MGLSMKDESEWPVRDHRQVKTFIIKGKLAHTLNGDTFI